MNNHYKLTTSLPTHCEKVADYWATLVCFDPIANGKARAMRYKAARAFQNGLSAAGLTEAMIDQAWRDTLEMTRLRFNAKGDYWR